MPDNNTPDKTAKFNRKLIGIVMIILICIIFFGGLIFILNKKAKAEDVVSPDSETSFSDKISALASYNQPQGTNESLMSDPAAVGNGVDDPNYANNLILSQIAQLKQEQALIKERLSEKAATGSSTGEAGSGTPPGYRVPRYLRNRLDPEYQNVVRHFQTEGQVWKMDQGKYEALQNRSANHIAGIEKELKELYPGATSISAGSSGFTVKIPAGTRIQCVTEHPINSDFVGYFTAKIRRPDALFGFQLIGEISAPQNDRIPTKAIAIVTKKGNRIELTDNQVEMNFPGLTGKVTNHWAQRVIPGIVSAATGAGASLYLLNSSTPEASSTNAGNISTRDLIAGPILESSVSGVQSEINRFAVDRPNTVKVQKGTTFDVLLITGLDISL